MRILRRSVAILLSAAMVLCAMPAAVFAAPSQGGWTVSYDAESYGGGKLKVEIFNAGEQFAPRVSWTSGQGTLTADKASSALFSGDGDYYAVVQYEPGTSSGAGSGQGQDSGSAGSDLTDEEVEARFREYYESEYEIELPEHDFCVFADGEPVFDDALDDYSFVYSDKQFVSDYNGSHIYPLSTPDELSASYEAAAQSEDPEGDRAEILSDICDTVEAYFEYVYDSVLDDDDVLRSETAENYYTYGITQKRLILQNLASGGTGDPYAGYYPGTVQTDVPSDAYIVVVKLSSAQKSSGLEVGADFFACCKPLNVTAKQLSAGSSYGGVALSGPTYAETGLYFRDGDNIVPAFITDPVTAGGDEEEDDLEDPFDSIMGSGEPESEVLTGDMNPGGALFVAQGSYLLTSVYRAGKCDGDDNACIDWENVSVGANGGSIDFSSGRSFKTLTATVNGLGVNGGLSGLDVGVSGGTLGNIALGTDLCAASASASGYEYTLCRLKIKPSDYDSASFSVSKSSSDMADMLMFNWSKTISGISSDETFTLPSPDAAAASYSKSLIIQNASGSEGPFEDGEALDARLVLSLDGFELQNAMAMHVDMAAAISGNMSYDYAMLKTSAAYDDGTSVVRDSTLPFFSFTAPAATKTLTATASMALDGVIDLSLSASAQVPVGAEADLAPAAPEGLAAAAPDLETLSFTWTANSEEDLAGYRLYRKVDGQDVLIATPGAAATSQTVSIDYDGWGEAPWYFALSAFDEGGNESAQCQSVRVNDPRLRFTGEGAWQVAAGTLEGSRLTLDANNAGTIRVSFTPDSTVKEADKPDQMSAVVKYKDLNGEATQSAITLSKSASYAFDFSIPADFAVLTGFDFSYDFGGRSIALDSKDTGSVDIIAHMSLTVPGADEYAPAQYMATASAIAGSAQVEMTKSGSVYSADMARKNYKYLTAAFFCNTIEASVRLENALLGIARSGDSFTAAASDLTGYVILDLTNENPYVGLDAMAEFDIGASEWYPSPALAVSSDGSGAQQRFFCLAPSKAEGTAEKVRFVIGTNSGDHRFAVSQGADYVADSGVSFTSGRVFSISGQPAFVGAEEYMYLNIAVGDEGRRPNGSIYLTLTGGDGQSVTKVWHYSGELETAGLTKGAGYQVSLPDNCEYFSCEPLSVTIPQEPGSPNNAPTLVISELAQITFYAMYESDDLGVPGQGSTGRKPIVPKEFEVYYKNKNTGAWTLLNGTVSTRSLGSVSGTGYLGTNNIGVEFRSEGIARDLPDTAAGLKIVFGNTANLVTSSPYGVPYPIQGDAVAVLSGQEFYTADPASGSITASNMISVVTDNSTGNDMGISYFNSVPYEWYIGDSHAEDGDQPALISGIKMADTPRAEILYTRLISGSEVFYVVKDRASGEITRFTDTLPAGAAQHKYSTLFSGLAYGSYDILVYITEEGGSSVEALEERFAMGELTGQLPITVCGTVLTNVSITEADACVEYNMPAAAAEPTAVGIQGISIAADKDVALPGDRISFSVHMYSVPGGSEAERTLNLTSYGSRLDMDSLSASFTAEDGTTVAAIVSGITKVNEQYAGASDAVKITIPDSDQLISGTLVVSGKVNNADDDSHAVLRAYLEGHDVGWDYYAGYCRIGDIAVFLPSKAAGTTLAGSGRGASNSTLTFVITSDSDPAYTTTQAITVSKYGYWKDTLTLPIASAAKADSFSISVRNAGGTEVWTGSAVYEPADVLPSKIRMMYVCNGVKIEVSAVPGSAKDFEALSRAVMTFGGDYDSSNVAIEIEFDDSNPDAWGLTDARRVMGPVLTLKTKRSKTPYVYGFVAVDNKTFHYTNDDLDIDENLGYSTKYRAAFPAGVMGRVNILYDLKTCKADFEAPSEGINFDFMDYMTEIMGLSAEDAAAQADTLKGIRTFAAGEDGSYSRTVSESGTVTGLSYEGITFSEVPGVPEGISGADTTMCFPAISESDNVGFTASVGVDVETMNEAEITAKIEALKAQDHYYEQEFADGSFVRYMCEDVYGSIDMDLDDGYDVDLVMTSTRTIIYDVSKLEGSASSTATRQTGPLAKGGSPAGNNVAVSESSSFSIDGNTVAGFVADAAGVYVEQNLATDIEDVAKAIEHIDVEKVPHFEKLREIESKVSKGTKVLNGINVVKTAYEEGKDLDKAEAKLDTSAGALIKELSDYIWKLQKTMTCKKSNAGAVASAMWALHAQAVAEIDALKSESMTDRKVIAGINTAGQAAAFIPEPPGAGTAIGCMTGMVKESETEWRNFLDDKTFAQISLKYSNLIYDAYRAYDPTPCEEKDPEDDELKRTSQYTWAEEVWPPCHVDYEPKIAIDPSGEVYEGMLSNPLEGVTVTIQYKDGETWKDWDEAPLYNDQQATYVTNASGLYKWDVPDGTWRVVYYKDGYNNDAPVYSAEMPVPPVWLDVNQNMVNADPASASAVAMTTGVAITFTKPVQADDVTGAAVTLLKDGEPVEAAVTLGAAENGLVQSITVETPIDKLSEYTVQVSGVKTYAGTESSFSVAVDTSPLAAVEKVTANLSDGAAVAYGSQLVLTAPTEGSQIYYTTNGVCPRNDAENRVLYTGPVTLTESSYYFRIRAFKDGTWSDGLPLHITVNPQAASSSGAAAETASGAAVGTGSARFIDVPENAWYAEAVDYVAGKGYFGGVSENEFAPNSLMTRGMFAAVLYRLAGEPDYSGSAGFPDAPDGRYYSTPIAWASHESILLGIDGLFYPDRPVTREQMVTILWRFIGSPEADASALDAFSDAADVSGYAREAMAWAAGEGLIGGKGGGILDPKGSAKRSEVAKVVMLFDKNINR